MCSPMYLVHARPHHVIDKDDLIAFVKNKLTSYKVPKAVHVLDALPTDPQGKVRKRELRSRFQ